jgi:hypothetical protein
MSGLPWMFQSHVADVRIDATLRVSASHEERRG